MLDESSELKKLIQHYTDKAEHWYMEYMDSGLKRHETAYYRNLHMAEALSEALKGHDTMERYHRLKSQIMQLDTEDEMLYQRVEILKKWISDGTI